MFKGEPIRDRLVDGQVAPHRWKHGWRVRPGKEIMSKKNTRRARKPCDRDGSHVRMVRVDDVDRSSDLSDVGRDRYGALAQFCRDRAIGLRQDDRPMPQAAQAKGEIARDDLGSVASGQLQIGDENVQRRTLHPADQSGGAAARR